MLTLTIITIILLALTPAGRGGGGRAGGLAPLPDKLPLGRNVARVFPILSLAMYPLKLSLSLWPHYLLNSGAGTDNHTATRGYSGPSLQRALVKATM